MKKTFLIFFLCITFLNNTNRKNILNESIIITYLGYSNSIYRPNFPSLEFEITNKSKDTLYISENNIQTTVIKNKVVLKQDKVIPSIGTPFMKPMFRKQFKSEEKNKYNKLIEKLKFKFANKLYEKNFGSNNTYEESKDFIIENIVRDCIILFPSESIDHSVGFYSKKFDKTCKVSVKYLDSEIFTYFVDDNGKKIDIKI